MAAGRIKYLAWNGVNSCQSLQVGDGRQQGMATGQQKCRCFAVPGTFAFLE